MPTLIFWETNNKKCAVSMRSLRIMVPWEVLKFGEIAHLTQVLQWTVAGYSRKTEKVEDEGLCST